MELGTRVSLTALLTLLTAAVSLLPLETLSGSAVLGNCLRGACVNGDAGANGGWA